jgi:hypothetical protein
VIFPYSTWFRPAPGFVLPLLQLVSIFWSIFDVHNALETGSISFLCFGGRGGDPTQLGCRIFLLDFVNWIRFYNQAIDQGSYSVGSVRNSQSQSLGVQSQSYSVIGLIIETDPVYEIQQNNPTMNRPLSQIFKQI